MFTILIFLAILSLLVFVHEFGHFWVARKFGLKPEEFGIGMPPRAMAVYKDKDGNRKTVFGGTEIKDASDTVYSINWLPLGGFVKLGEDDDPGDNPNHFNSKPIWQRASILLAGVSMNVLLAFVLIVIGFIIGSPVAVDDGIDEKYLHDRKIQISAILPGTPAEEAGLQSGDVVVSINDVVFENFTSHQNYVDRRSGEKLIYKIKRGDDVFEKEISPVTMEETGRGGIGIGITETAVVKYPFHLAVWQGFKKTFVVLWMILAALYDLIKGLIIGNGVSVDVAGPIGIAKITGEVARMGFIFLMQLTIMLSLNLAIINALPYPALDGGRVLFLIIEKFKGSPVKKEVEGVIHYIGFATLMLLIVVVTVNDISKYGDFFIGLWNKVVG